VLFVFLLSGSSAGRRSRNQESILGLGLRHPIQNVLESELEREIQGE
jgi:hypothetical protein